MLHRNIYHERPHIVFFEIGLVYVFVLGYASSQEQKKGPSAPAPAPAPTPAPVAAPAPAPPPARAPRTRTGQQIQSKAVPDILACMLKDTTSEHKSHLFDLKCKICTGD